MINEKEELELLVAGGYGSKKYTVTSEIFSFSTMKWRPGPELPNGLHSPATLQNEDQSELYLLGGYNGTARTDKVMKYDKEIDGFVVLPQRLKVARSHHCSLKL